MTIFNNVKEFYPTPQALADKMIAKLDRKKIKNVLDPSAGKGNLLEAYQRVEGHYDNVNYHAIEQDSNLQATLRGKDYRLVDSDFLNYAGGDQFDAIIMNPPFSNGDLHLLKAIDVLYSGEIVCLLNAETLKNRHTNTRKDLMRRLIELKADVEFLEGEFETAERKTSVEVALIHIVKYVDFSEAMTKGMDDVAQELDPQLDDSETALVTKDSMAALVKRFEHARQMGIETILEFYKRERWIGKYLKLEMEGYIRDKDSTRKVKIQVNEFLARLRLDYWQKAVEVKEITEMLTEEKRQAFLSTVAKNSSMDFTLANIRQFILNLSGSYMDTLMDAAEKLFDDFTRQYAWSDETSQNILHYNGWKTNDAYKVNNKVIQPYYSFWDTTWEKWKVPRGKARTLDDIDKVMSYFNNGEKEYVSIAKALEAAFEQGQTRNVESTFFRISVFKKGTMHLTFKDEGILRRFNTAVGRRKNWLPRDYGKKSYSAMNEEEKAVVNNYETENSYTKAFEEGLPELPGFSADNGLLQLENAA